MKTKITVLLILFGALVITTNQSCKKYPENPILSLKSRTERVSNIWGVDNYKINDVDYTSLVTGYSETFTKEGAYSYEWGVFDGTGTWSFQNNDKEILLTGSDDQTSRTLFIIKLEENAFWYYYMDGSDKHELHLIGN